MKSKAVASGLAGLILFVFIGCIIGGDRHTGRGSEVENEFGVYGVMVDVGGKPVQGAWVSASPSSAATGPGLSGAVDSVLTDSAGRYRFARMPAGIYNLEGRAPAAGLVVRIPDLLYAGAAQGLDVGVDTLKPPGSIRGQVLLGAKGKEGAIAYLPGTSYLALSDSAGVLEITGVPEGKYQVSYLVPGYHADPDTGVRVQSGLMTRLQAKLLAYDTAYAPPPPSRLEITYDTLASIVRLVWSPSPVADLFGYQVFRDSGDGAAPVRITEIVQDTFFADTLRGDLNGSQVRNLIYRVGSIDRKRNASVGFSPPAALSAPPPSLASTSITLSPQGSLEGKAGIGDTVRWIMEANNPTRGLRQVRWSLDGTDVRLKPISGRTGIDTLAASWPIPGSHTLRVTVWDDGGRDWIVESGLEVVMGGPLAMAGGDVIVSIGDTVRLDGTGTDGFGAISKWEWDAGNTGNFLAFPDGHADVAAPSPRPSWPCVFRVTDDDGLIAMDTLIVKVVLDVPRARLSAIRQQVFRGDTVRLSSIGSEDGLGRIVKREWDIGMTGRFREASGPDTAFAAAGPDSSIACALRITDDDGLSDTARIDIGFHIRDHFIGAGTLPANGTDMRAWVFGGKAWISGRPAGSSSALRIWNSEDMVEWKVVEIGSRPVEYMVSNVRVSGSKMWFICRDPLNGTQRQFLMSSTDGVEWAVDADHPLPVADAALESVGGKLLLIGGTVDNQSRNTAGVWTTADGVSFQRVSESAAFGERFSFRTMEHAGRVWLAGGFSSGNLELNDVWSSADGAAWTRNSQRTQAESRNNQAFFAYQGELWLAGGFGGTGEPVLDMWRSADGEAWRKASLELPEFQWSSGFNFLGFKGKVYLVTPAFSPEGRAEVWQAP